MATFSATNNATTQAIPGDIVKSSGQTFGVVPALANSADLFLLGTWLDSPGEGRPGTVVSDGLVEVNCIASVSIGDKLYLDPIQPGKATKIKPAVPCFLGVVVAKRMEGSVQKATVVWRGGESTAQASVNGTPATGSITCVKEVADNDGFTLSDGTDSVIYEYRRSNNVYSTGSILAVAKSSLLDNEKVTLNDGVNPAVAFEFQITPNVYATGTIACVAVADLLNNEKVTLDDGVNEPTVFEFKAAADAVSSGSITAVAPANLVNNEGFVLDDGVNEPTVFEFKVDGTYVATADTVTVDVSTLATPAEVAGAIKAAIDGVVAGLAITCGGIVDATIPLTNDAQGPYNAAIVSTVANEDFIVSGMSGGSLFVQTAGTELVDVSAVATAAEVATVLAAAIEGVGAGLAIAAAVDDVVANQVNLVNDAYGPYNAAIVSTVANEDFTVSGMSGGSSFTATPDTTLIDLTAVDDTAAATATAIKAAVNGVGADLAITADIDESITNLVTLVNDAYGFYNDSVETTVANEGFVVSGMSGGEIWTPTQDAVEINVRGLATDQAIADATYAVLIDEGQDFNIPALTSRVISLQNGAVGVAGNVAITKTNGCPLTVSGMSGGTDAA